MKHSIYLSIKSAREKDLTTWWNKNGYICL